MISATKLSYIEERKYDNAAEFLSAISYGGELYDKFGEDFIFRGQSDNDYLLLPSALRQELSLDWFHHEKQISIECMALHQSEFAQIMTESAILMSFFNHCDKNKLYVPTINRFRESVLFPFDLDVLQKEEEWLPKDYYEIAGLAQHYGLPTRLLDWSYDINVALYFATMDVIEEKVNGKSMTESEWIAENNKRLELFKKKAKDSLLSDKINEETKCEDKRIELWALDSKIIYEIGNSPLTIIRPSYYGNENLAAQKGLFTLWKIKKTLPNDASFINESTEKVPLDKKLTEYLLENEVSKKTYLYHITIPKTSVGDIYEYIKRNNIDAAHLFPGYSGITRGIKEELLFEKYKHNQKNQ